MLTGRGAAPPPRDGKLVALLAEARLSHHGAAELVTQITREALDDARALIAGGGAAPSQDAIADDIMRRVAEALRLPLESWTVSWADLYRALRRQFDDGAYRAGKTVRDFDARPDAAEALFSDGERRSFDLLNR